MVHTDKNTGRDRDTDRCIYSQVPPAVTHGVLPFPTNRMEPGGILLNEISQMEKGKRHMNSLLCGI